MGPGDLPGRHARYHAPDRVPRVKVGAVGARCHHVYCAVDRSTDMAPKGVLTTVTLAGAALAATLAAQRAPAPPGPANIEWRAYAGDLRHQHYSPLDQIDATNFSSLEVAWRFKTDSLGPRPEYKLEGTPLEINGILYTTA